MWIFLNDAFLSIVSHTERPDHLHVRARLPGDIERTFPSAAVTETPTADYRYRTDVPRAEVARVLADRAASIDYPNFKASIGASERERQRACGEVWGVMRDAQRRA
jgi:hypothetical protein